MAQKKILFLTGDYAEDYETGKIKNADELYTGKTELKDVPVLLLDELKKNGQKATNEPTDMCTNLRPTSLSSRCLRQPNSLNMSTRSTARTLKITYIACIVRLRK